VAEPADQLDVEDRLVRDDQARTALVVDERRRGLVGHRLQLPGSRLDIVSGLSSGQYAKLGRRGKYAMRGEDGKPLAARVHECGKGVGAGRRSSCWWKATAVS